MQSSVPNKPLWVKDKEAFFRVKMQTNFGSVYFEVFTSWPRGRVAAHKILVYFTSWQHGGMAATPSCSHPKAGKNQTFSYFSTVFLRFLFKNKKKIKKIISSFQVTHVLGGTYKMQLVLAYRKVWGQIYLKCY